MCRGRDVVWQLLVSVGKIADALECERVDGLGLLTVFVAFREREEEMVMKGKW